MSVDHLRASASSPDVTDSPFMKACRREPVAHTPVWLMRQAGRYLPEYRRIRARFSLLDLCKTPSAAAELTVLAVERLRVDAAIIFADILLITELLGSGLEFVPDVGPVIAHPIRAGADVQRLRTVDPAEGMSFVFDAIRLARRALGGRTPLIGFAGGAFTVASYLIEGRSARDFLRTKSLMYEDPSSWHDLMQKLTTLTTDYLNGQIAAGADAVQIFDSWIGCLAPDDYRRHVLPYTRQMIAGLAPGVPVIHFGTGTGGLLELMREAGGDVIGLDWRVDLGEAWQRLGEGVAVQGNLDPALLLAGRDEIRRGVRAVLTAAGGRPGHIFNLGHGVLPNTPWENAVAVVDMAHEESQRPR